MSTVYLIRHGQKMISAGDPGLTDIGVEQAKKVGIYLAQFPITNIISSPSKRTRETATQIAQALNLVPRVDKALVERMDWIDSSITRSEFLKDWIKATNDRNYIPNNGSSSRITGERIHMFVQSELAPDAHLVLVTHGGAIVDYLRNLFGDQKLAVLRNQYDEGIDYKMSHCAINKVILDNNLPVLELLNHTNHMDIVSE